jgi:hypothetical protein
MGNQGTNVQSLHTAKLKDEDEFCTSAHIAQNPMLWAGVGY